MEEPSHVVEKNDREGLREFLVKNGQALLPMVELIERSEMAVDELIDAPGRATIEAVLRLSAQGIAGPPQPVRRVGRWGGMGGRRERFTYGNGSCG